MKDKGEEVLDQRIKIKRLVADLAYEIRNGFLGVFPNGEVIECNYHVQANIDKRLKKDVKNEKDAMLLKKDITKLQLAQSEKVFEKSSRLMVEKWEEKQPAFVDYFKIQYVERHCSWYEGKALLAPSTNVAQESTHGKIKMTFTNRRRVSMQEMKNLSAEMVKNWSMDLITEKPFEKKVIFTEAEVIEGYLWAKQKVDVVKDPDDSVHSTGPDRTITVYWVCLDSAEKITSKKINDVKRMNYNTFDLFCKVNFQVSFTQLSIFFFFFEFFLLIYTVESKE